MLLLLSFIKKEALSAWFLLMEDLHLLHYHILPFLSIRYLFRFKVKPEHIFQLLNAFGRLALIFLTCSLPEISAKYILS